MSDLTASLYRVIAEKNEPRLYEAWHASSMADCPRAHYFKRLGIEATELPGAGKILRWAAGHNLEAQLRPHLKTLYPDLLSNVRLSSKERDLTGEYDNFVPSLGRIIEVKSVHDFAIKVRDGEANLRDGAPYLSHEIQNHAYVILLREAGFDPKEIEYLYVSLGGLMTSYRTPIKSKLIRNVEARLKVLNEAWRTHTPPDCICSAEHPLWGPVMQYCDYKGDDECCSLKLMKG